MSDVQDVQSFYQQTIRDFCHAARQSMTPEQNAIIDAIVMVEIAKRGGRDDFHLELRLVADKHQKSSPYLASCLKCLADLIRPRDAKIIPIFKTTPPGGNPCP